MWRRVCGIGVDGANAIPVERVAACIGILITFAERGLADEEFEDFGHGGGIDQALDRLFADGGRSAGRGKVTLGDRKEESKEIIRGSINPDFYMRFVFMMHA